MRIQNATVVQEPKVRIATNKAQSNQKARCGSGSDLERISIALLSFFSLHILALLTVTLWGPSGV